MAWLITGRCPAWRSPDGRQWAPESAEQKGIGWAASREVAVQIAADATWLGWLDVTIWEPELPPQEEGAGDDGGGEAAGQG